jgi:hypothetical protein
MYKNPNAEMDADFKSSEKGEKILAKNFPATKLIIVKLA